jgi:hypothetical protein
MSKPHKGTEHQEVAETVAETPAETAAPAGKEGVRARRAFMLKHFIPNADWINQNIVSKGAGTKAIIGRVFGVCFETMVTKTTQKDGRVSESVALKGAFQAEDYKTGEISEATTVYLPMAYAEKVAFMFKADPELKAVEVDVDIGLEATGKTIPYEWVVIAYREGEAMAVLKRLRASRSRPTQLLLTVGPKAA